MMLLATRWLRVKAIFIAGLVTCLVAVPAWSQEAQRSMGSTAEASRNAREQRANSTKQARLFTNADVGPQNPVPEGSSTSGDASPNMRVQESTSNTDAQTSTSPAGECDSPEAARLRQELQATEQELDRVRSEFLDGSPVISGNDLDVKSFKPGYAGLDVGTPPLSDSSPPVPARVAAAQLEERISALNKALRIACESPEAAEIQIKIDQAGQELNILEWQFALDNENHYSKPNYVEDTAGKAQLDAELQEIENKRSEIIRLRDALAAVKSK